MISPFFYSKKWSVWSWCGGILLIISLAIQVEITVLINSWYGNFYNLLQNAQDFYQRPDDGIRELYIQLISFDYITNPSQKNPSFLVLVLPYVVLVSITNWFSRLYALKWREAITFCYIDKWKKMAHKVEGASQRIQEDCARWAILVENMGLKVIKAFMGLIAFLPILWTLSDKVELPILKDINGSLVLLALVASLGGLLISWFVGIKLPGLEYNNQKSEAAFRKDLVLAEDDKVNYANDETVLELFLGIKFNYHRLYAHYGYFDLWINLYDQMMTIVPYLAVGPSLFTGAIKLGIMIQVGNAFDKVHSGFALFLNHWTTINEIRSVWKRLREFENKIIN